jgi:hypothetical protein
VPCILAVQGFLVLLFLIRARPTRAGLAALTRVWASVNQCQQVSVRVAVGTRLTFEHFSEKAHDQGADVHLRECLRTSTRNHQLLKDLMLTNVNVRCQAVTQLGMTYHPLHPLRSSAYACIDTRGCLTKLGHSANKNEHCTSLVRFGFEDGPVDGHDKQPDLGMKSTSQDCAAHSADGTGCQAQSPAGSRENREADMLLMDGHHPQRRRQSRPERSGSA